MKNRIVIWGEDEEQNKVLLTLELMERENKVQISVFPQAIATESFYQLLMDDWKEGKDVDFPEGFKVIERPLSMTDNLLPDELKTDKSDILTRAQAEWHFTILSGKLYEVYKSELDEFKEKVDSLTSYSEDVWNEMKEFWGKVQGQVRERNMFRDHAATLKERTNNLFDKLKVLRKEMKKELDQKSNEINTAINSELDEIEAKVKSGLALSPVFAELKEVQNRFFKADLNRKEKDSTWARIDSLFKTVKEKQFGDKGQKSNKSGSRVQSRLDGLLKAIQRMETSISFDKKDVDFQNTKISTTDGQLEMQIRQAKLVMIKERLNSKQSKLDDMLKTKQELLVLVQKEKEKEEQAKLELEKKKVIEDVKQKIADEIKSSKDDLKEQEGKLNKAAKEIKAAKLPKADKVIAESKNVKAVEGAKEVKPIKDIEGEIEAPNLIDKLVEGAVQIAEDISDTISAVVDVVEDKIENTLDSISEEE